MDLVFGDITVACTNTNRIVFPDCGITKGDVIAYYRDVAEVMLPELRSRPLTIERFTKGIDKGGFFSEARAEPLPGVDPARGARVEEAQTAHLLRELFEQLALPVFVKTTGSKGLHVISPLDGHATYDVVSSVGDRISKLLCARHPEMLTTEFYKKDRKGRLYLDTMRNAPGATIVAPYSLRARPGAPVSAPIAWSELDAVTPDGFRLKDVLSRLDRIGDPWKNLRSSECSAVDLARALDDLTGTSGS